jgi:hypothetical protein
MTNRMLKQECKALGSIVVFILVANGMLKLLVHLLISRLTILEIYELCIQEGKKEDK